MVAAHVCSNKAHLLLVHPKLKVWIIRDIYKMYTRTVCGKHLLRVRQNDKSRLDRIGNMKTSSAAHVRRIPRLPADVC